ncbi:MAG: PH domain-containing protein [Lachnospiraceae bacterium]
MAKKQSPKQEILWKDRKHHLWFPFSFTKYYIKNDRLYQEVGFLNTRYDETLLYRIIDLRLERTLAQKIFGTGTIKLFTKADSEQEIYLVNIKRPLEVKDLLSNEIEKFRHQKNIVGREFYSTNFHSDGRMDYDEFSDDDNV